uniref:Uncharacterized protein n=1 Tax=Oryzias melastigma TaxID=30732 RepID=A0A3B3CNL8_ORYME
SAWERLPEADRHAFFLLFYFFRVSGAGGGGAGGGWLWRISQKLKAGIQEERRCVFGGGLILQAFTTDRALNTGSQIQSQLNPPTPLHIHKHTFSSTFAVPLLNRPLRALLFPDSPLLPHSQPLSVSGGDLQLFITFSRKNQEKISSTASQELYINMYIIKLYT